MELIYLRGCYKIELFVRSIKSVMRSLIQPINEQCIATHHIETSQLICNPDQLVVNGLMKNINSSWGKRSRGYHHKFEEI